jgi:hypothetical protein
LMFVWAAALVAVDKTLNHAPPAMHSVSGHGKPQIGVTFTHFCCTGCYDKMFSAAKSMSWIVTATTDRSGLAKQEDLQKAKVDEATNIETMYQKDATLLLDERDLRSVDMVRVQREFRDAGLMPKRLVLDNVAHFRLIAVDPHLCCGLCESAAMSSMKLAQTEARAQARKDDKTLDEATANSQIMPAFSVDKKTQRITAEYFQRADVTAFRTAIERAGFSPKEIRIETLGAN